MKKWIVGLPIILVLIYVLNLRSNWPKPSMGEICKTIPQFETYSVSLDTEKLKSVDLDSNKMAKEEMKDELLAATSSAVNFSGKFVMVNHDCGLGCQKHAVVDTNTTKIVHYGLQTSKIFKYQPTSRLIIADSRYYEFKNDQMNYLCETKNNE